MTKCKTCGGSGQFIDSYEHDDGYGRQCIINKPPVPCPTCTPRIAADADFDERVAFWSETSASYKWGPGSFLAECLIDLYRNLVNDKYAGSDTTQLRLLAQDLEELWEKYK